MAKQRFITDFTAGNVPKQLLRFATPLLLANLLQAVYNMADMVIVGRVMGSVGLSAVSVGGDVSGFLTFLAMGFSNAGQVIISQYIGAGQRKKVGAFVGTMFAFLTACALVLCSLSTATTWSARCFAAWAIPVTPLSLSHWQPS